MKWDWSRKTPQSDPTPWRPQKCQIGGLELVLHQHLFPPSLVCQTLFARPGGWCEGDPGVKFAIDQLRLSFSSRLKAEAGTAGHAWFRGERVIFLW